MTTNQKQFEATIMQARLVLFARECGFDLSLRTAGRSLDEQRKMVAYGKSETMNSAHLKFLAFDFVMFRNGDVVEDSKDPDWKVLGDFWKNLSPHAVWGGDWGWDAGHFEYKD